LLRSASRFRAYEFGVKVYIVTTNARAPGGQFVLHAKALPGNPYDGHTLAAVVEATERLTGCTIERGYLDKASDESLPSSEESHKYGFTALCKRLP
jgi:hypothetical protein